jgi:hypothetical protein
MDPHIQYIVIYTYTIFCSNIGHSICRMFVQEVMLLFFCESTIESREEEVSEKCPGVYPIKPKIL